MTIPEREPLLQRYDLDVETAYNEMLDSFLKYLKEPVGDVRKIASRCGAQVAAAHKRCKRDLMFAALNKAVAEGVDITPTVAEHMCGRLIGRGVDYRSAMKAFGTPGRTAAVKSPVTAEDLASFEAGMRVEVHSLIVEMTTIRERHKDAYSDRVEAALEGMA